MPIEIRELNIKAYIDEGATPDPAADQKNTTVGGCPENEEAIIAACVEQVLQILKDKEER